MAAIQALEALKRPCRVRLYTDSLYVRDGVTKWIHGWKKNGWRTADKKPVKNVELWQRLDAARAPHQVDWNWVKGHSGHVENERADQLARDEIGKLRQDSMLAARHSRGREVIVPAGAWSARGSVFRRGDGGRSNVVADRCLLSKRLPVRRG